MNPAAWTWGKPGFPHEPPRQSHALPAVWLRRDEPGCADFEMAAGRPQPTCAAAVHLRRTSSPAVASHYGREAAGLATVPDDMRGCGPLAPDLKPSRRKSLRPRSGRTCDGECVPGDHQVLVGRDHANGDGAPRR